MNELMLASDNLVGDFGTVLDGNAAVREGIIDETGTVYEALEELAKLSQAQY